MGKDVIRVTLLGLRRPLQVGIDKTWNSYVYSYFAAS